jgi:hypothetical protein
VSSRHTGRVTALVLAVAAAVALGVASCGYDTHNQNTPNSTQVGTNTADPTP